MEEKQVVIDFPDGSKYVGGYKDNKLHGHGKFISSNGNVYEGQYYNDEMQGQGTFRWADGGYYTGEFYNGKPHGQGTYHWADGCSFVGEVRNGELWTGTEKMKLPNGGYTNVIYKDGVAQQNNEGCYIATCVYGSYDCPQVWTLRHYRDNTLAKTWYGRTFIKTYYAISPTIVKWFGETKWFKNVWRKKLDSIIEKLESTEK